MPQAPKGRANLIAVDPSITFVNLDYIPPRKFAELLLAQPQEMMFVPPGNNAMVNKFVKTLFKC
jgi:hypothetical protein